MIKGKYNKEGSYLLCEKVNVEKNKFLLQEACA